MRSFLRALTDLLRGLFAFPDHRQDPPNRWAATLEERYRRPRRCC